MRPAPDPHLERKTTARGDKYYIARATPLYWRRRCCFAWPVLCALPLLAIILFTVITVAMVPSDRLVLADNTTQPMVNGTWTDVNYDETLIASVRWSHVEAPPGPNGELVSVEAGTYTIVVGIHPAITPSLFSLADPPPAPCGTCPCEFAPCSNSNSSLCCDPDAGWTLGNMSVCGNDVCYECLAENASCISDNQCRCGGRFNMSCLPHNSGFCTVDYPDAPCGFCPCWDAPCSNNSDCCDPLLFNYSTDASYCNGFLGGCQPCISPGGACTFDSDCNCFDIQYRCLPNFTSFQFECTFVPSLPPTHAPTAPIPCTNWTQCPYNFWCNPNLNQCFTCLNQEGVQCCNTTADCAPGEYCSPTLGTCETCAYFNESCDQDPASACGCNVTDDLVCDPGTQLCVQATPTPTNAPTVEPICPDSPTINARLVRQRNPNPLFVPIAGPFVPVLSGGMYVFGTGAVTTQVGDIYKVQWYSPDCPFMSLTPVPFNLASLGVPGRGIENASAYLTATLV